MCLHFCQLFADNLQSLMSYLAINVSESQIHLKTIPLYVVQSLYSSDCCDSETEPLWTKNSLEQKNRTKKLPRTKEQLRTKKAQNKIAQNERISQNKK